MDDLGDQIGLGARREGVPRARPLRIAAASVALLAAGCGAPSRADRTAGPGRAAGPTTFLADGISARIPPGWHVTAQPVTTMSSPVQRLVVTSFAVHQDRPDGGCRPATALRQMPPGGALLFMFEYQGPTHHDAAREPARPARFRLDRRTLQPYECVGRSYMVRFRDHGRVFQAHSFFGPRASATTRRRLLAVLDSLRVRPQTPRAAAVWRSPGRLLSRTYMGVACHRPNWFGCDRLGLTVWLRAPARAIYASIAGGRPIRLADPLWSGPARGGLRRRFAGFLQPAGLVRGPLRIRPGDGSRYWSGEPAVRRGVGLTIELHPDHWVRTSLVVDVAPGWG